ncbi:MAG: aminotransferase class IV [Euryarchaeota archaeon]
MPEPSEANPRDSVFTTIVWDQGSHLADFGPQLKRMEQHARRLRISWPEDMGQDFATVWKKSVGHQDSSHPCTPLGLIRVELTRTGDLSMEARTFDLRNEGVEAITLPAPRWSPKINGTKHGDWQPYREASKIADSKGADLALLVHDFAVVDADRATPVVFDEDGTAWFAEISEGGVSSITAEALAPMLESEGIPVHRGRLNERLIARALEVVALGSGIGASRIESIDGEAVGEQRGFTEKCQTLLTQHYENDNAWSHVGA